MHLVDHYLQIRDITIYNKKIKKDFKVLAIGDIHLSKKVSKAKINFLKQQLYKENPDYIAFLGDFINSPDDIDNIDIRKEIIALIKEAASIAKTMVILGNHDFFKKEKRNKYIMHYNQKFWNHIANINNVYLLNNDVYKDNRVLFMGYMQTLDYYYQNKKYEDPNIFYNDYIKYSQLYKNLNNNLVNIGLIHSPQYIKLAKNVQLLKDYDLLISGHNHDGCIPLGIGNFNRGIISPKKEILPKEVRGYITLETGTNMLMSGGIVKIQDCAPKLLQPLNHLCPMQIDIITFTSIKQETKITKRWIYMQKTK